MRDFLIMIVIALFGVSGFAAYEHFNPRPPSDLEVVYFGSTTCGSCVVWKREDLPRWRRDPASRVARVQMAEVSPHQDPWSGGYGHHDAVFMKAFGSRGGIAWPSYVVLKDGDVDKIYVGRSGWRKIEQRLRREASRREKWEARERADAS